jgi:hypothetical protein
MSTLKYSPLTGIPSTGTVPDVLNAGPRSTARHTTARPYLAPIASIFSLRM